MYSYDSWLYWSIFISGAVVDRIEISLLKCGWFPMLRLKETIDPDTLQNKLEQRKMVSELAKEKAPNVNLK